MCVNGDESEPATFNNRLLIEQDPHQFIEGILIAASPPRRASAYVYLRFEYIHAFRIMERAIAEAREAAGHLGKNIYGSGFDLEIYCHRGAGAYICGEETGLIESLEGKRGWPRIKPPFPAIEGAFKQADGRQQRRDPRLRAAHHRAGGRLVQVDGHAQELRAEALLRLGPRQQAGLRRAAAGRHDPRADRRARGGVWKGRKAKAVVPGGISMGVMSAERARRQARLRGHQEDRLPRPGDVGGHRDGRPDQRDPRLPLQLHAASSPTRAAASAPPAGRGRRGCTRRSSGSRPAAAGSRTST